MKIIECKNCNGKGHVLSGDTAAGGPFIWVLAFFETRDSYGLTRETCETCNGKGHIKVD